MNAIMSFYDILEASGLLQEENKRAHLMSIYYTMIKVSSHCQQNALVSIYKRIR